MKKRKRGSDRSGRATLRSPGRPPTVQREDHRRFWAAIATGQSSEDAASLAGVSLAVGDVGSERRGGMPPAKFAPSAKLPSKRYLQFAEREEIAVRHAQGLGVREIARQLGRAASTISRELRRNAATRSGGLEYRATTAQWHADRSARRSKVAKLVVNPVLRDYVQERLVGTVVAPDGATIHGPTVPWKMRRHGRRQDRRWGKAWSPEQISWRLRLDFPEDPTMRISHEAIYQALFIQGRGALRRELTACLRTGRTLRVPMARIRKRGKAFITPEIMISQRPAEVADQAVPGHWEGDLIIGLGGSAIGTLVERTTRFTMLLHLPPMPGHASGPRVKNGPALAGHGAEAVRDAIARTISTLPAQLRRSLTWDQGAEMAQHANIRIDTGLCVYFCDPRSPWQRGTNGSTNGLLRQYYPKGTNLTVHDADTLAAVALALNTRLRKTLSWKIPAEVLDELLRSIDKGGHEEPVATTA
ncbi:IS30 family transposase [Azospirillum sp. INR13]|uniref:IS30 family transposase n=1 Tax=Azospirillum sp. INR13 TaxID=2596919 RepID=UPI001892204E|nr:IS30 family transposase [Azospirillum sp. INR13]MBF5093666.1 IS30 family transposase [Azospirillum sp. INR13]